MVAVADPTKPFVWGQGGAALTPEEVARQREIAEALIQGGMDYSPVQHWLQGAARMAQGGLGGLLNYRAREGEAKGKEGYKARWDEVFGGGSSTSPVAAALASGGGSASVPQTADAQMIREGLIARGLPEHVADGFLMNMQDESGLNPGINEAKPLVPGSRGGYGLYQLTGPRRVAYERFAADRGVDPSDVDAQLDFLMTELQGPEAKAAQSILSAPDAGSAAAAIARDFLRPAPEHLARRVAAYTSGGAAMPSPEPVQVASVDESIGMPASLPPIAPPSAPGGVAEALAAPPDPTQTAGIYVGPPPQQPAAAPPQAAPAPMQTAQAPQYDMNALLGLASDPWASDAQKQIAMSLLGQQMEQQQMVADPMRQMELERAQLELEALRNPPAPERKFEVIGGELVSIDPATNTAVSLGQYGSPETTAAMQNFEFLVSRGMDEATAMERAFSGGTNVTVNTGDGADSALNKALSTKEGELWSEYKAAAAVSGANAQDFAILDELIQIAPQGPITGRLAETFKGFSSAGDAFQSIVKRIAPTLRAPGSGATSDIEYDGMLRSLPALGNTPEANAMINSIMKAKAAINVERGDIITQYQDGVLTIGEARAKMDELNRRSILTPEMQEALLGIGGEQVGAPLPSVGEIVDGYRYNGGDPASPESWTRVN